MTREEAIELIESARKTMYLPKSKEYISDFGYALEMAIKALEQEPMRDATPEELKSVNDYINSISKPTGVKFDFDEEQEQIDFVQPHRTVGKLISVDVLDKIRTEIERKAHSGQWSDATMFGMMKAVAIIDKYKAESEDI